MATVVCVSMKVDKDRSRGEKLPKLSLADRRHTTCNHSASVQK